MNLTKKLNRLYNASFTLPLTKASHFVIMSDCHRGIGNHSDNFLKNQHLFFAAINYYYQNQFTYIELGDGDELWENRNLSQIIQIHSNIFWLMSKFYEENRFYSLYGNHDIVKKFSNKTARTCHSYYCESLHSHLPLFPNIHYYESLVLKHDFYDFFLFHGHQGDLLNDSLWPLARFLVRYVWRPLELLGFLDPTSAAKNYMKKNKLETSYQEWADKQQCIVITGHTHRPACPVLTDSYYFNSGSCVHPRCITALEIDYENILLVKWSMQPNLDNFLYVAREVLATCPLPLTVPSPDVSHQTSEKTLS